MEWRADPKQSTVLRRSLVTRLSTQGETGICIFIGETHHRRMFMSLSKQFHIFKQCLIQGPRLVCCRVLRDSAAPSAANLSAHDDSFLLFQLRGGRMNWFRSLWHPRQNFLTGQGPPQHTFVNLQPKWLTASLVAMTMFHYRSWWIPERLVQAA